MNKTFSANKKLKILSVINIALPIPMITISILWSWILFFGIGVELLGYDTVPMWIMTLEILPIIISPLSALYGIIYGFVKIKEKYSVRCIILSFIGLLINTAFWSWALYQAWHF